MAKPRVHEIAAEIGVDSKTALAKLKELGEFVKSPSSTIEPPVARKLRAAFEGVEGSAEKAPAAKAAAPKSGAPAGRTEARPREAEGSPEARRGSEGRADACRGGTEGSFRRAEARRRRTEARREVVRPVTGCGQAGSSEACRR